MQQVDELGLETVYSTVLSLMSVKYVNPTKCLLDGCSVVSWSECGRFHIFAFNTISISYRNNACWTSLFMGQTLHTAQWEYQPFTNSTRPVLYYSGETLLCYLFWQYRKPLGVKGGLKAFLLQLQASSLQFTPARASRLRKLLVPVAEPCGAPGGR